MGPVLSDPLALICNNDIESSKMFGGRSRESFMLPSNLELVYTTLYDIVKTSTFKVLGTCIVEHLKLE